MSATRPKNVSVKKVFIEMVRKIVESEAEDDENAGRLYVNVLSDESCRR
jgi:hypothetical protein